MCDCVLTYEITITQELFLLLVPSLFTWRTKNSTFPTWAWAKHQNTQSGFITNSLSSLHQTLWVSVSSIVRLKYSQPVYFIRKLKKTDYFLKSCLTSSGRTDMLSLQSLYYNPALITNTAPTTPNRQFRVCGRLHFPQSHNHNSHLTCSSYDPTLMLQLLNCTL